MKEPDRPKNVIFIMADQLAAAFLGCYGSGVNSSPTLDRLAQRGVRFGRCYASAPICAPNRGVIATGRCQAVHGIVMNNFMLMPDNPTYAHLLRARGYRTAGFGKFHLTPMPMAPPQDLRYLGFDETVVTEDPKWGPWIGWIEREHPEHYETALAMCWGSPCLREYGPDRKNMEPAWRAAVAKILKPIQDASEWPVMYPSPLPAELHQTTYITNRALDFLDRHVKEQPDEPFFCHVSYVDPHDPYDPPAPYSEMFRPDDMPDPLPAGWAKNGNPQLEGSRDDYLHFRAICDNVPAIRKMRALYHGSIRLIDDQIARIVDFLDANKLWDDTILVFTTDHGDMMGDHGLLTKGNKHFDKGIHCPLIVCGAGVQPGVQDRLTCSLDFFPTFCDWAGIPEDARPPVEGRSFAPACTGEQTDRPDEILVSVGGISSILTDDGWRLTLFNQGDLGEMYCLADDPNEQNDLFREPAWQGKQLELTRRLACLLSRQSVVQQYRNLPYKNGRRWLVGGIGNGEFYHSLPLWGSNPGPEQS